MGVLAVEVDEAGAQLGQRRDGSEAAVDVGAAATRARHDAAQHDLDGLAVVAVAQEPPLDHRLLGAGPDHPGIGAGAHEQGRWPPRGRSCPRPSRR